MKECDVTRDLLPLYIDKSCSEDSREYVDAHIAGCESCRAVRDAASKTVQTVLTGKKVKKSFHQFRRKTNMKKTLIILLCVLAVLIPLGFIAYDRIGLYLYMGIPARIEPTVCTVSQLSDGSIYVTAQYTDHDVWVNGTFSRYQRDKDNPGTYYIELSHIRKYDFDERRLEGGSPSHTFIITTAESYPKYDQPYGAHDGFGQPYTRIVLVGPDGERVLWEEGDELPAADIQAEAELASRIDGKWIVSVDSSEE